MDSGYVALWRKTIDSQVFNNPELLKVWVWCLCKASIKKRWVSLKTGKATIDVEILPGQFIFGRHSAAKQLRMKSSSVRNRMEKLQTMQNVDIDSNTQYSIITILNWDSYQVDKNNKGQERGQAKDRQRTGKGQAKDTNNNVDNVDNVFIDPDIPKNGGGNFNFKTKVPIPKNFHLTDEMIKYAGDKKINMDLEYFTEGFILACQAKGYKYKNWYATWQTWIRREWEKQKPTVKKTETERVYTNDPV